MQSLNMTVGFEELKVHCLIGTLPAEKTVPQEICVSLKITLPKEVIASKEIEWRDEISATVDYTLLADICTQTAMKGHHGLLETLATEILDAIFARVSCLYGWIKIEKPGALKAARCAFVEQERWV